MKTILTIFTLFTATISFARNGKESQPTTMGNMPLQFIANKGQITDQYGKPRRDIDYKLSGGDVTLFIGDGQLHYQWVQKNTKSEILNPKLHSSKKSPSGDVGVTTYRMDVELLGADKNAVVVAEDMQPYYENYYLPTVPDGATANSYRKITYKNVYPHIDWVLYTPTPPERGLPAVETGMIKYDFVVNPGGNINDIVLKYGGASKLELKNGALTATTPYGSIREDAPYTYYAKTNEPIESAYKVKGNTVSFTVPSIPEGIVTDNPVVIDPSLFWASYYGGTGTESAVENATDTAGNIYIAGITTSTSNIATTGAHQTTITGTQSDGFVAKFDINGVRQWATYYGGANLEQFIDIASDPQGNLYITGIASSAGLATTGAHQASLDGTSDAILLKLNSSGVRQWATYYGGVDADGGEGGITISSSGDVYMALNPGSSSTGLATTGAFQTTIGNGCIVKFNSSGVRQWATYVNMGAAAVCTDNANNMYVVGQTQVSTGVATAGAHQTTMAGAIAGALMKFNSNGARLWGTYYSGTNGTSPSDVKCDLQDNVYICGYSSSTTGIATPGAYKTAPTTIGDGFLAKFNSSGVRQWGTYFGGNTNTDRFTDIVIDSFNKVYLFGYTASSTSITTANAYKPSMTGATDNMFIIFSNTGQLLYGSYFGGSGAESALSGANEGGISYAKNKIIFCHATNSTMGMPTTGSSHQPAHGGSSYDGYIAVFNADTFVAITQPFTDTLKCGGDTLHIPFKVTYLFRSTNSFTIQLSNGSGSFASPTTIGAVSTNTQGQYSWVVPSSITGGNGYRLRIIGSAPVDTFYLDQNIRLNPQPVVTANSNSPLCSGNDINFTATSSLSGGTWTWTGPASYNSTTQSPSRVNSQVSHSGDYIVTHTLNGCSGKDTAAVVVNLTPVTPVAGSNGPLCVGSTIQLTAGTVAGATYTWSGPAFSSTTQNPVIANAALSHAGTYSVYATLGSCTSATTTTNVSVVNGPTINFYPSPNDTVCGSPAGSATLVAVPANPGSSPQYQWYKNGTIIPGATSTSYAASGISTGDSYYVVLTPGAGAACTTPISSNSITMMVMPFITPTVSISANPNTPVPSGTLISFTAVATDAGTNPKYQWKLNGVAQGGATSSVWSAATFSNNDKVSCEVTSSYICPQPPKVTSSEVVVKLTTSIKGIWTNKTPDIYPNPAKDKLIIEGISKGTRIQLIDVLGRTVINQIADNETEVLNTNHLIPGNYMLSLDDNKGNSIQVVKE